MTRRRREAEAGAHSTTLSLAVRLVDVATGERPTGEPSVAVDGPERIEPAAVNPSGYRLFLDADLPPDPLQLLVDGGERYADDRIEVSRPAAGAPAVTVQLAPAPQYPFGPGATIVRGVVEDPAGEGVAGAVVTVQGLDWRTRTNDGGEFVLFLGDRPVETAPATGTRRVTVDGDDPTVEISHRLGDLSASVTVEAGTVTRRTFPYP